MIEHSISHVLCLVETGKIPMKRSSISSCFLSPEINFLAKNGNPSPEFVGKATPQPERAQKQLVWYCDS
jgi:hypothetical protein